ncbi:hypothetical protein AB0F18_28955 [Streptomyces sp. NPDC029216]|uniref:hypothetical protein n=1 Tax=Streptomyces sp. NPDC029216 TaxID=3154701 RepID=UPI0033FC9ACF
MLAGQGRRIRCGAVLVAVVLSLTGFSTGGSNGKSDSGGGGCSSSKSKTKTKKKSHGSGIHTDAGPDATASPTTSAGPATAVVVSCVDADASHPSSTIEVTSRLDRTATFSVTLRREGVGGGLVETATALVTLEPRQTRKAVVPLRATARAGDVRDCRIGSVTTVNASPSPSPSATPAP